MAQGRMNVDRKLVPEVSPAVAEIDLLSKDLDELASRLNRTPPCENRETNRSCLARERERLYIGHVARPVRQYDDARLCNACSASWHVSIAALALQDAKRWTLMGEAAK